jgi:hypothetical protein
MGDMAASEVSMMPSGNIAISGASTGTISLYGVLDVGTMGGMTADWDGGG